MTVIKCFGGVSVTLAFILILLKLLMRKKRVPAENKVVLITGASSGLGEALAHVFYEAGAKVILCARREGELRRVKQDLLSRQVHNKHEPVIVPLDLSQLNSLATKVRDVIDSHGNIDVLINNGGMSYRGEVCATSLDVDDHVMRVNYLGQVTLAKAVLPSMLARGSGHLVFISSVQGKISIPFRSSYSASKHALQAFADCVRAEVSHSGVKVTLVSPAYIRTNLSLNAVTQDGKQYGVMDSTTASGMLPENVAKRVLECVEYARDELVLAPIHHRLAICLRALWPQLFFWVMKRRAAKQRNETNKAK